MLTPEGYISRIIDNQIQERLKIYGAICIEGPKWCGKTWTALHNSGSKISLGDPSGNFQNKRLASMDPKLVLEGDTPRLVDEWQEVPQIWDAVKFKVDELNVKGRYILTGSSSPRWHGVLHSGSGRIGSIRMRTMSQFELGNSTGSVSIMDLFNHTVPVTAVPELELIDIINMILKGGWPSAITLSVEQAQQIAKDYLLNIPNDMEKIDGKKRNVKKVASLIRSLGRNESTQASKKTLSNDMIEYSEDQEEFDDIPEKDTITEYLDSFAKLFLIEDQPSFDYKLRSSVKALKKPKRHYTDPSLAAAAIGATAEMLMDDLETLGFFFESLCVHDLRVYAENIGASVYHYRDEQGKEADAIVQLKDGRWGMFEIKLGFNQVDDAAESLKTLSSTFLKETGEVPEFLCVLGGQFNASYRRDDGVYVIPLTALK